MITPEQKAAIQQAAYTMKRRADSCTDIITATPPATDEEIISECIAIIDAWKASEAAFGAVIP